MRNINMSALNYIVVELCSKRILWTFGMGAENAIFVHDCGLWFEFPTEGEPAVPSVYEDLAGRLDELLKEGKTGYHVVHIHKGLTIGDVVHPFLVEVLPKGVPSILNFRAHKGTR